MRSVSPAISKSLIVLSWAILSLSGNSFTQTPPPSDLHILSLPYYSAKDGWDSILTLSNSPSAITVSVTLYALDGSALPLSDFPLGPNQSIAPRLSALILQAGGGDQFKEGSIELRYRGAPMGLGVQLTVANSGRGLSFDMEPPMGLRSSRLEGLWWSPDTQTSGRVMLSNTTHQSLSVQVNVEWRGLVVPAPPLSLARRQTMVLPIRRLLDDLTLDSIGIGRGGLSITHNGLPGALIAHGVILNPERRFASNLRFIDPAAQPTGVLEATGLPLGRPAPGSALPSTSFFVPVLALKNASSVAQTATVNVQYRVNGRPQTQALPPLNLTPHEVRLVDFWAWLESIQNAPIESAGLQVTSSGRPGTLVAALTSIESSDTMVVDVPLVVGNPDVRLGGKHPFRLDGNLQAVTYLKNISTRPTKALAFIVYEGGLFTPPLFDLAAGETVVPVERGRSMRFRYKALLFLSLLLSYTTRIEAQDWVDLRVPSFEARNVTMQEALTQLRRWNIPVCLEKVPKEITDEKEVTISIKLENASVREILDALVKADPRYLWEKYPSYLNRSISLINVLPVGAKEATSDSIMNIKVKTGTVRDMTPEAAIQQVTYWIPELVKKFHPAGITGATMRGIGYKVQTFKVYFEFEDMTLREIMNEIALRSGGPNWVFEYIKGPSPSYQWKTF